MVNEPSLWETLGKTLASLPKYVLSYVVGLLCAILSNIDITNLALFAVAVGFFLTPWAGVAAFFGLYALTRTIGSLGDAAVHAAHIRNQPLVQQEAREVIHEGV